MLKELVYCDSIIKSQEGIINECDSLALIHFGMDLNLQKQIEQERAKFELANKNVDIYRRRTFVWMGITGVAVILLTLSLL